MELTDQLKQIAHNGLPRPSIWKALTGHRPYEELIANRFYDATLVAFDYTFGQRSVTFFDQRLNFQGFAGKGFMNAKQGQIIIGSIDDRNKILNFAVEIYQPGDIAPFTRASIEEQAKAFAADVAQNIKKPALVHCPPYGFRKKRELALYFPERDVNKPTVLELPKTDAELDKILAPLMWA